MRLTALTTLMLATTIGFADGSEGPGRLVNDTYHHDQRSTPKLQFAPAWNAPSGIAGEELARLYLSDQAATYGLPADLGNLELSEVQESLLGTHYRFQQRLNGYAVESAQIVVSVSRQDGSIYRVYNQTYPVKSEIGAPVSVLGSDQLFDLAWNALHAQGALLDEPRLRTVYVPAGDRFQLQSIVELALDAPYGTWSVRLDAERGTVISIEDLRILRVPESRSVAERLAAANGPVADRIAAFVTWRAREAGRGDHLPRILANGTGVVFDPDPRTTLASETLQDTSPGSAFTGSYFTRALLDIAFNGTTYSLTGPWCNIINWDPPATAPSTTTTGNWTATRGNNAFNDALCYFHIDQNQRYMQSLGFVGATGIQDLSIGIDTDGVNGSDNSYFVPSSNRIAYGHGCVDDSEDADVVLHEYGHAIHYGINSSWGGGDSGAIGEGFGDYWAGSYSYSTLNGSTFHPEWVFSWDGHGVPASCWNGRILNAFGAQYVPGTTYGAHQTIPGGFQSDELWSTPLFQSLIALIAQGETREEVDQIILESHFGLGSGITMRDMGNATIATAALLQPGGPHADVFTQKFLVHNIVDVPAVSLTIDNRTVTEPSGNGAPDPGEQVALKVRLHNVGTLDASGVTAILSTGTSGVTIDAASSAYDDLPIGASGENLTDFLLSIDTGFECGDPIQLSLAVTYGAGSVALPLTLTTGVVIGVSQSVEPHLAIPDNNATGVTSTIVVFGTGATVTPNFNVDVDITHTYIGDLKVQLRSPANTLVLLHNRTGGSADNLVGNYPGTLTPAQPLSAFFGQPLDGQWKLTVIDAAGQDIGTLNSWGINDIQGYDCDSPVDAPDATRVLRFALAPSQPNPARGDVTLRFEVARADLDTRLEILDVAGRHVRTLQDGPLPVGTHQVMWNRRDDSGREVGAGMYFYRLRQGQSEATRKLLVIN